MQQFEDLGVLFGRLKASIEALTPSEKMNRVF
jgi:hypothetical protein